MPKKALILIAHGVECTSASVSSTASSHGHGSVGISPAPVVCSRGIKILPDTTLQPLNAGPDKYDVLIIPGGLIGSETLSHSIGVQALVREYYQSNKIVAMICAGTLAAKSAGLPFQPITSHPIVKKELVSIYDYKEDPVVISEVQGKGTLVTSRGPGTAFPFAFKLVELLCGKGKCEEVQELMMFPPGVGYVSVL